MLIRENEDWTCPVCMHLVLPDTKDTNYFRTVNEEGKPVYYHGNCRQLETERKRAQYFFPQITQVRRAS